MFFVDALPKSRAFFFAINSAQYASFFVFLLTCKRYQTNTMQI